LTDGGGFSRSQQKLQIQSSFAEPIIFLMLAFAAYAMTAAAFYFLLKASAPVMEEALAPVEAAPTLLLVEGGGEVRKAA
jgi:hypothetical protein